MGSAGAFGGRPPLCWPPTCTRRGDGCPLSGTRPTLPREGAGASVREAGARGPRPRRRRAKAAKKDDNLFSHFCPWLACCRAGRALGGWRTVSPRRAALSGGRGPHPRVRRRRRSRRARWGSTLPRTRSRGQEGGDHARPVRLAWCARRGWGARRARPRAGPPTRRPLGRGRPSAGGRCWSAGPCRRGRRASTATSTRGSCSGRSSRGSRRAASATWRWRWWRC